MPETGPDRAEKGQYALAVALLSQRDVDAHLRSGPQMREYEAIADRIAADAPGRVLDWGCGFGQLSALLARRDVPVSAFEYCGDGAVEGPQPLEHFPEIQAYVSSEPVGLPYEDDEFDAVLSCGVLEHVQDPDGSLDELRRILRPRGTLYVYKLPNRMSWLEGVARLLGLYYHGKLPHDTVYTKASAVRLIRRHGFVVTEVRRTNILPLTLGQEWLRPRVDAFWRTNVALARLPLLNTLATNIEVIAAAP